MKKYFFLLLITIGIFSCKKEDTPIEEIPQKLPERNIADTAYGTDTRQKLDIYLPANRTNVTKTIVLIHGGGWSEGSKNDLNIAIPELQKQLPDYAIANVGYRLAKDGANLFPAQENDIKSAVVLLEQNADKFYISKSIVIAGFSAGAHLALLHAYKNDPDKNVKAVIDFFGPTDLTALWNYSIVHQLLLLGVTGKTYDQDQNMYKNASPINYATAQSPPTIILQGDADNVVPPAQSTALAATLENLKVTNQLVVYAGAGHGWTGTNLQDSYVKIKAFIEKNVK